jgi:hypothetical protein
MRFHTMINFKRATDCTLFEIARVLVRFNHVARIIVNADHSIMWASEKLCAHKALAW